MICTIFHHRPTFNLPNFLYKEYNTNVPVKGNGDKLGLVGFGNSSTGNMVGRSGNYIFYSTDGSGVAGDIGVITDQTKSGIVGTLSQKSFCNMIIKY